MISLNDYHQDFLQDILTDAESRGLMKPQSFFEAVCEDLISTGELTNNYTFAEYKKTGIEVYGYDYDPERKILSLLVHQFFQEDEIQTLTKAQIDIKFKRLNTFIEKCSKSLHHELEETSEAYSMAFNIHKYLQEDGVEKIRLMILTDGLATRTLTELPPEKKTNYEIQYRVIDINYLYNIFLSDSPQGDIEIDVDMPCLKLYNETDPYISYLTIMKGEVLAEIYEDYGKRLLEQNVRTFLQFRGAVNKGLRNTIEFKPEMFFAYNNGITATASEVQINVSGHICKIKNFQIVNGGQTTSAIYAAKKNSKLDVSKVAVQVKLSVVNSSESHSDFISKVAEYANTQNKINKSDFFSNSPFHIEMKTQSQRISVPASGGSQRRTHWFYERVRGEYLNEQAYLKENEKKKFELENPKKQMFDKTLLAKCENTWGQRPDIVSKGAQDSFVYYAENITKKLDEENLLITELFFKESVSRVILFKETEKIITKASWYDGGFRAQTVAYSISYLANKIEKQKLFLNFEKIWELQGLPDELYQIMEDLTESIYKIITNPPQGSANIAQWTKQSSCWDTVKKLGPEINIDNVLLIDKETQKYKEREDITFKKIDTGIEMQIFVVNTNQSVWKKLYKYYSGNNSTSPLSSMQSDMLKKMSNGLIPLPSEKQSKILYSIYQNAKAEGVDLL